MNESPCAEASMNNIWVKVSTLAKRTIPIARFAIGLLSVFASSAAVSYEITDSFGRHWFEQVPKKIVVTDWALLQQLLDLGIQPIGAPELKRYRHYVGSPELPANTVDIGLRHAPNLATIRELKPDIIVLGTGQKELFRPFSLLSERVLYYSSFSARYNNYEKSRQRLLELGTLFNKQDLAKKTLASMDIRLAQLRQQVQRHFDNKPPKVTLIRFSSPEKVMIYGENSLPLASIKALDMASAIEVKQTKWGYKEVNIEALNNIDHGLIFYISPLVVDQTLVSSAIWQQLSAYVKANIYPLPKAWSHGGALSVLHTSELITQQLLTCQSLANGIVCRHNKP